MTTKEAGREFIEHYGVKGMQWGVRKSRKTSSDSKKASSIKKKKAKELSNDELDTVLKRMNLEQRYSAGNPSKAVKGLAFATTVLAVGEVANKSIALVKSPAAQAVKSGIIRVTKKVLRP